jgi:hypothetical protein
MVQGAGAGAGDEGGGESGGDMQKVGERRKPIAS